jgi:hypothetical protein
MLPNPCFVSCARKSTKGQARLFGWKARVNMALSVWMSQISNLQPPTSIISTFSTNNNNNTVNAPMSFSVLPLELFRAILAEAIIARQMTAIRPLGREYESFKQILRLRLVNSEHLISNLSYNGERRNKR